MTSQRPKRQTEKPSRFSQSPSFVPPESQLSAIPEVRRPQKRPLQAILVEPIPKDLAESLPSKRRSIPSYTPPLGYIEYTAGSGVSEALDELSTFLFTWHSGLPERQGPKMSSVAGEGIISGPFLGTFTQQKNERAFLD
jgi:hypothetical protein